MVFPSMPCGLEKLSETTWKAFLSKQQQLPVCATGHEEGGQNTLSSYSAIAKATGENSLPINYNNGHKCVASVARSLLRSIFCGRLFTSRVFIHPFAQDFVRWPSSLFPSRFF